MKDFFEGIAWLFENVLFIPLDALRTLQLDSWWLANIMNWIFMIIGAAAFIYWMLQLKKFDDEEKAHHNRSHRSTLS
ncbi:hypothetical protein SAMN04487764_0840 [Gillisia sp. Hel1_33_143]|uniref:DUF6341 family protein n=1 Tax=unclassified Gillisia TaxID=2615025 RepID=UPI000553B329|nr:MULTISPECIES: hypothetical protein [unclassified Gillisia]SDR84895.1 hypothetical protein SAMN04487764_0840 [Gillisia sp. Hel1_33_143]